MEEGKPSFRTCVTQEERMLYQKAFEKYDKNKDGFIDANEFKQYIKEYFGLPQNETESLFRDLTQKVGQTDKLSLADIEQTAVWIKTQNDSQQFLLKLEHLQPKFEALSKEDSNLEKHHIKLSTGDLSSVKSSFTLRAELDYNAETSLFKETAKGLKFQKNQIGFILKLRTKRPQEARERVEKIIKLGLVLIKNTVLRANSPEALVFNTMKFEYSQDEQNVIVAVHSEHKGLGQGLEYLDIFVKEYKLANVKAKFDAHIHCLHNFNQLLNEDKDKRMFEQVVKEGIELQVDLLTNCDIFFKKLFRPVHSYDVHEFLLAWNTFLQQGSFAELHIEDIDLEGLGIKKQFNIDFLSSNAYENPLCELKKIYQEVENYKLPVLENIKELLETYLLADIQLSFNVPWGFGQIEIKTAGIKELWQKLLSLE